MFWIWRASSLFLFKNRYFQIYKRIFWFRYASDCIDIPKRNKKNQRSKRFFNPQQFMCNMLLLSLHIQHNTTLWETNTTSLHTLNERHFNLPGSRVCVSELLLVFCCSQTGDRFILHSTYCVCACVCMRFVCYTLLLLSNLCVIRPLVLLFCCVSFVLVDSLLRYPSIGITRHLFRPSSPPTHQQIKNEYNKCVLFLSA